MLRKPETPAVCRDSNSDEKPNRAFSDCVRFSRDPALFIGVAAIEQKLLQFRQTPTRGSGTR